MRMNGLDTTGGIEDAGTSGQSAAGCGENFADCLKLLGDKTSEVISIDSRIRATAADGFLRAAAVSTTETARAAQSAHQAWPVAAAAMGRLISTAAILASGMKEDQGRITVEVSGGGPLGRVVAEVRPDGAIRARVQHPSVDLPLRSDGKLPVGQAVGPEGYFRVWRQDRLGNSYQGQVELKTGEIGEDFSHYLMQSEQIPSAVAVGVLVGQDGFVMGSGGILVQALPGCPAGLVDQVAAHFDKLTQISRRLADGETLENLVRDVLPEPIRWHSSEPLQWHCWCERDRIEEMLSTLPDTDLGDLIEDGGAEVTCHFCRKAYHFTTEELQSLRRNTSY